jgi:hypothetical protein
MPDFAQFFEQALAEQGIDAQVVQDDDPTVDQFYIAKPIGDEKLTYTTTVNTRINTTEDEIRKEIVREARTVAQQFEEYLTDTFEWGKGRRVTVSAFEDGWAECGRCGNKIDIPDAANPVQFVEDAELSTPQPFPRDRESVLNNMDDGSRLLLKMYLIGRLRERCGYDCPNQKFNDRDKSHAYKQGRFYDYDSPSG